MSDFADSNCTLCHCPDKQIFAEDKLRVYLRCESCHLVYVPEHQYLEADIEKSRYDLHENEPDNPGYREFLSRLKDAMTPLIKPNSTGLDFGSGPIPVLSTMFAESGHTMVIYDHFYAKDSAAFDQTYDFIAASEVVEHLHNPLDELDRLWALLKPGGILGMMTRLLTPKVDFDNWHYKRDDTHVCFFTKETFEWLGRRWGKEPAITLDSVVLFEK